MQNIKIEMNPPTQYDKDKLSVDYKQRIQLQLEFTDEFKALTFIGDLQKLIKSYMPEAE